MTTLPYTAYIIISGNTLARDFDSIKEAAEAITRIEEKTPGTRAIYIITQAIEQELKLALETMP